MFFILHCAQHAQLVCLSVCDLPLFFGFDPSDQHHSHSAGTREAGSLQDPEKERVGWGWDIPRRSPISGPKHAGAGYLGVWLTFALL